MVPVEGARAHQQLNAMNARSLDARSLREAREVSSLRRSVCRHLSNINHQSVIAACGSQRLQSRKNKDKKHEVSVRVSRRQVVDESSFLVGSGGGIHATTPATRAWHAAGQNTSWPSLMKPNLAFKRTPNGRPRNGIMFILAFTRPAVWRRLTLR
jgi:hypothetical protein